MKIKNLTIKNKSINYENLEFDFSRNGIYQIKGKNGSGKTCILEEILFGKYCVEFENERAKILWEHNRAKIFSYIPQNITDNDFSVYEYIVKGNSSIKYDKIIDMLQKFLLNEDILKNKFKDLSGGEKKKIQIISALLKDGQYIFIDEPSNNLDNSSTEILSKILNEISETRAIIIVSHDDRLSLNIKKVYELQNNSVILKEDKETNSNNIVSNIESNVSKGYFKIISKLLFNIPHFVTILLVLITMIVINTYVFRYYHKNYNNDKVIKENIIIVQDTIEFDSSYYSNYLKTEKIKISDEKSYRYINLNDIPNLSKQKGIENIYFFDIEYCNKINSMIYSNTISDSINFVSIPMFYTEIYKYSLMDIGIDVIKGNYPQDYKNEVSISTNLLVKYFGYTLEQAINSIGEIFLLMLME